MRTSGKWVVGMVASFAFATGVQAIAPGSPGQPYNAIPDRNLFGLKPPQVLPEPVKEAPPLPKVILTGVTDILGMKLAFLKVQFPAKPGEPAKEQSMTLKEGEREGAIEVVDIDLRGTVQVKNSGTMMPVTFDKLPPTPAPAPTAGATPNVSSNPGAVAPTVPTSTTNPFSPSGLAGRRPIPTRTIRLPVPVAAQNNQPAPTSTPTPNMQPNVPAATTTVPATIPNGVTPAPGSVPNAPGYQPQYPAAAAQGSLTPEEQLILQELERQKAQPAPQ